MTTLLIALTVVDIALLVAGLAFFLFWVGTLLTRIAGNLEAASDTIGEINADAELIRPGLDHINHTGGVVAGALPLLYDMAEGIVAGSTYVATDGQRPPAAPASGHRRSRALEGVGLVPD